MKLVIQTLLFVSIILISKADFGPNVGDDCDENNNQCNAVNGIFCNYQNNKCGCLNEEGYNFTQINTSYCCANLGSKQFYDIYLPCCEGSEPKGSLDNALCAKAVDLGDECNDLYLICMNPFSCIEEKCIKRAGYNRDDCTEENTICDTNQVCDTETKKCKCENDYIYVDWRCIKGKFVNLGENCDDNNVCTPLQQKCDSTGKCVCQDGFKESAGNCVLTDGSDDSEDEEKGNDSKNGETNNSSKSKDGNNGVNEDSSSNCRFISLKILFVLFFIFINF